MYRIINVFILLFLFTPIFGQVFTGTVLDRETKQIIPYAQVYLVDLEKKIATDENGIFKINYLNQSFTHIQISAINYKPLSQIISLDTLMSQTFYMEQVSLELEKVVLSRSSSKLQNENIVSIERKKISELQQSSPLTLTEAISNIPGVEQTTTGSGIGKPVIRGLSGNRIVSYAQGIRVENQQWGDEHGLGVGEVGIESVEIIKGPASLLYGSDALGGVLYFVDERYAKPNTIESFAQTRFVSNTLGSIDNIGIKIHRAKLKFNLFATYSSHSDFQTPHFERVFNTRFNEKNIKSSIGFNLNKWTSNIRYSYLQNNYGIVENKFFNRSNRREFILPFQKIDNHNLSFENIFYRQNSKIKLTVGYANNYRKEFEDDATNQSLGLKLNTFTHNLKWYSPTYNDFFSFIIGSQGMAQSNINNGEEILIPDANINDLGVFVLGNLKMKKIKIQSGIRSDFRKVSTKEMITNDVSFPTLKKTYNGFTLSGGAVYQTKKIKLRANISSGFRAPNTTELLSDGIHHGTNRYIKGSTNLLNENAIQVDLSFDYKNQDFHFSINPFYNTIQNYIFLSPTKKTINNNLVFEYLQSKALLYGGEMGFYYHPHKIHWLYLNGNLSNVIAKKKNGVPLPLIPQTKLNSTMSIKISHKGNIQLKKIFIQHIYKFRQNRIDVFETSTNSYNLIHIGVSFRLSVKANSIKISTGVKNLFNHNYIDHLSRFKTLEIPNQGINYYIALKIKLNKKLKEKKNNII